MSFAGFIAFTNTTEAGAAQSALDAWIAGAAKTVATQAWTTDAVAGSFSSFSLVDSPAHEAVMSRGSATRFVGDVPAAWAAAGPGGTGPDRLARRDATSDLDPLLPETEFAGALWNDQRHELMLLRCRVGARAVYYVAEPERWVAFASLPEPLLRLPRVRDQVDEAALPAMLLMGLEHLRPADATLFVKLRRVPPAHVVRITAAGVRAARYWQFPDVEPLRADPDDPEVPRTLRRLLAAAVSKRTVGRTVATQLSGGLDSSAVTALACETPGLAGPVHAYTVRSYEADGSITDPESDQLAEELARRLTARTTRLRHSKAWRPYYLSQREYLERPLPDFIFKLGADHRMMAAARGDGCGVMLTGWGGDEMATARGSLHVLAMWREGRWRSAWQNLMRDGWVGAPRALWTEVAAPLRGSFNPAPVWDAEDRAVVERIFGGKALATAILAAPRPRESVSVRRRRRDRVSNAGFAVALELQDWMAQRAGMAVCHPLLDRDVLLFCDRLSAEWIGHLGVKRRAFREATKGLLPESLLAREKARLSMPAGGPEWTRARQARHNRAVRDLADSPTWLHGYMNLRELVSEGPIQRSGRFNRIGQIGASAIVVSRLGPGIV
jgi:hypothetical protein